MTVSDPTGQPLTLRLFGPFEAHVNGAPLPRLRSRKGLWLLALLALRQESEVERDWLAGTLWPDSTDGLSAHSLRVCLADLRRALGPEAVRLRSPSLHTLALDLSGAPIDVVAFDQAIARGDEASLEEAISLYRGPLLEGCVEEWAFQERQAREQAYLAALEALAAHATERSDPAAAERALRRAVGVDPLRESAQRALMQALAGSGNYNGAAQVYQELRRWLRQELNSEPDPVTQALFQQLRAEARGMAETAGGRRQTAARQSQRRSDDRDLAEPRAPPSFTGYPAGESPVCRLPTVTVTFMLTDIEGSTRHWLQHPEAMRQALARHDALAAAAMAQNDGLLIKQRGEGDSLFAVFPRATDAVAAALDLQQALAREAWPAEIRLQVRVALHTGEAELREGDYFGLAVNHGARLRAVGHGGQTLLSQTTAALVRDELPADVSLRELGVHRLKDLQRPEPIFQLLHPELPAAFPPLRSLEAFAHNLPVQLTRFIGREREMADVRRLLPTTHLLTLTGAGGCGKTRLALQIGAELVEGYEDGVWLVELAALAEPGLVPQAVASALGVREEPGRSLTATLTDTLRAKQLLLVLDNCEHLLSACAELADALLRSCPGLRMLATSREALGIGGEQTYRVPSLALPEAGRLPPLERLQEFEAVQLFADRARSSQATFAVTQGNAPAVARVCQRLDGIPLALELAAARVKALPVEQLSERLDDMFRLLTGGSRTALPRQQTLRSLIDWSYDLLTPPEGALLCRLSVFAGGWTLAAAEAVCDGEGVEEGEVLDLLSSLVDKSLVLYLERGGEGRYRLLETVRQYGRDRLVETGEIETVRMRHRDFFLRWAQHADANLSGAGQAAWVERLETEHDNLRTALNWCRAEGGSPDGFLCLVMALRHFWLIRSHLVEGGAWLDAALERSENAPPSDRARLLNARAWIAGFQGNFARMAALSQESLPLARGAHDTRQVVVALVLLGRAAAGIDGDLERAASLFDEARSLALVEDDRWGVQLATHDLGHCRLCQGHYEQAAALLEEGVGFSREVGEKVGGANCLFKLGKTEVRRGNCARARAYLREAVATLEELGDRWGIVGCLGVLALLAEVEGEPVRAATVLGAVRAAQEAFSINIGRFESQDCDRCATALRADLGEEAFAAAWAEGRAMSLEEVCAYALQEEMNA